MKCLLVSGVSLLLLGTTVAPAVQAQTQQNQGQDSFQQNQMDQDSLEDSNQNQRATPYQDGSPGSVQNNQQTSPPQDSSQPAAGERNQNTFAATGSSISQYEPTPFELVSLARQGYLQSQGVPSYATLTNGFRSRNITSEDIIQAAIDVGRLPASRIDDAGYISGVRYQLIGLDRNSRN